MHPINPRLELQPDFREGRSSRDCWAVKILGWERRRFGRLGSGTGRKWSSLKVVCVATIKSKKLKRLSLRPPSSVICSVLWERPAGAWMEGNMAEDEKIESLWATLNANFNFCIGLLCGHWQIKILCWTTEHQSCCIVGLHVLADVLVQELQCSQDIPYQGFRWLPSVIVKWSDSSWMTVEYKSVK